MIDDAVRQMLADYRWSHHQCVYCSLVPKAEYEHCNGQCFTVEHLWQRMGGKLHDPANLVVCCEPSHRWKHANSVCGRIVGMAWKLRHGEFDRDRLRSLIGLDPVGWVANRLSDGLPAWAASLGKELVEAHQE